MTFDPIDFLERAVGTPSHDDVAAMRDLLVETLRGHGHEPEVDDAGNVVASRGDGRPHVVLNTHLDTVPPHVPFGRDGDVIRGRGACDAKGPLAALLAAFLRADPPGRLTLAVTPDEETLSRGAAALNLDGDAYVVGEPTGLGACNAARGRFEATVALSGSNAHAAEASDGVNAVAAARHALAAIESFDQDATPHPSLGGPALTATVIRGGDAANQVPDDCEITVDRRSVPPESAAEFRAALHAHVREHVPPAVGVDVRLADRDTPFLEAWETPADAPLIRAVRDAAGGEVRPFTAATEAAYFAADGPTVVFGPGVLADDHGAVAHSDREYVRVPEVRQAADAVTEAVESVSS
jgi:acetylornithine deacetylase